MVTAYQPSGGYKIMSGNLTMKVGDQVNLTVYDEKVDVYSELEQKMEKSYTEEKTREIELALVCTSIHKRQKNKPEKGL